MVCLQLSTAFEGINFQFYLMSLKIILELWNKCYPESLQTLQIGNSKYK